MAITSTRSISDGSRATAWPLGRDVSNTFGATMLDGGRVPFENLLKPKASIQVLHAQISQSGHQEFDPDDPEDFTKDPDKRYKVRTYAGTITNSAGRRAIPPPDPLPPDYEPQFEFLARDTSDSRVTTYELSYSATDTEEAPDGWKITDEGERTVGEVYVYSTGALEDEPEPNEAEGGTMSATLTKQVGNLSGEITCTLSEVVTLEDLTGYCAEKLSDLKSRADDELPEGEETSGPPPVSIETEVDSFQTDALTLKMATVRMVWEGSGMFAPLAGKLTYFSSPMQPSIALTTGTWEVTVSNVVSESEKYYDGMGVFGTSNWWDTGYSNFGGYVSGPLVTPNDGLYPGSGIPTGNKFSKAKLRWFSADGLKRRIKVQHSPSFVGSPETGSYVYETSTLETSPGGGFAQATSWLDVDVVAIMDTYRITESIRENDDGSETLEFGGSGEDAVIEESFWQLAILSQEREASRWGFIGFTSLKPVAPGGEPEALPDVRYRTVAISSSSLKYSAREPEGTTPDGVGRTATADMTGSYTWTKPSEWKLGSLVAERRFSKTTSDTASPFKIAWSSGGHSGERVLNVIPEISNMPNTSIGPFSGSGDELSVSETSYRVSVPEPSSGSLPVRTYRMRWDRSVRSNQPYPTSTGLNFTLPGPPSGTYRQVSAWDDLPTPPAGTAFWTETNEDEFSCFVGS